MARDRSKDIYILDMPLPIAILAALSACVTLGFLGARVFYKPFRAPSASMEPAISPGEYIFAHKFADSGSAAPRRGDIIVFRPPSMPDKDFVKRVVGIAGDRVQMIDGAVFLNGVGIDGPPSEPRAMQWGGGDAPKALTNIRTETLPGGRTYPVFDMLRLEHDASAPVLDLSPGDDTQVYDVPAGHVFVLGDFRDNSADSRYEMGGFGFVPVENIVGKVTFVLRKDTHVPQVMEILRPH
jgi:signal peptidase I